MMTALPYLFALNAVAEKSNGNPPADLARTFEMILQGVQLLENGLTLLITPSAA